MALWKQTLLVIGIVAAAFVLSASFLPVARPFLDKIGVLEPLMRMGLAGDGSGAEAAPAAESGSGVASGPPRVVAMDAAPRALSDIVTSIGTARAVRSVAMTPEVSGRIVALNVQSGDYVNAGQVVAELDSEAARIAVDRAGLVVDDARATVDRQQRLKATGATSDLLVQEANLALKTAELELRQAQFELAQHRIVAPISGWVGIFAAEVGNQVTTATEITRIEDRTSLLVDFRVPERIVSRLSLGDALSASPLSDPGLELPGRISAFDNRVEEASRSLLLQAAIENTNDRLRSGMAILISLGFTGASHPAVDPLAIQWGSEGAYVWAVRDAKALRIPVHILQRNADVVLVDGKLEPDDLVVIEGVQQLRVGSAVIVAETRTPKS
ncbi:MAG: efflux RND transporter periplasmic adaptor subunit [Cereibacter sphaeroides]|uniref:Efflux RND transporter periplasmic adaptor subunit n=1 Tax=Cereibacter sphaeroides TaxID=1063 RepID=A0A2W5SB59_CERSP|nr:MAG: efflux RND transporter periplasmic adaptor subunit [Cereibacter sphaeroides]